QTTISGSGGGLVLNGQRDGHRMVVTGFNPFPYLGKRNLPMSVLTLNMLGYLAGFGARTGWFHTGEPWTIPAGVTSVTLPSGRQVAVEPSTLFTSTDAQGIYHLNSAHLRSARAVNLDDLTTSDLETIAPITVSGGTAGNAPSPATVHAPLTPYILAVILFLIVLESILVYRRRRMIHA
ncbi:MAG TPA: hypothetical protein VHY56_06980, partial [Candidatus Binataceae bacterium]|nr:hypothetical protein [Candidatus Binataceae bacterium]